MSVIQFNGVLLMNFIMGKSKRTNRGGASSLFFLAPPKAELGFPSSSRVIALLFARSERQVLVLNVSAVKSTKNIA